MHVSLILKESVTMQSFIYSFNFIIGFKYSLCFVILFHDSPIQYIFNQTTCGNLIHFFLRRVLPKHDVERILLFHAPFLP